MASLLSLEGGLFLCLLPLVILPSCAFGIVLAPTFLENLSKRRWLASPAIPCRTVWLAPYGYGRPGSDKPVCTKQTNERRATLWHGIFYRYTEAEVVCFATCFAMARPDSSDCRNSSVAPYGNSHLAPARTAHGLNTLGIRKETFADQLLKPQHGLEEGSLALMRQPQLVGGQTASRLLPPHRQPPLGCCP